MPDSNALDQEAQLNSPLLAALEEPVAGQLLNRPGVRIQAFEPGELIHLVDEPCDRLDIILEGQVTIQYDEADGRYLIVTQLGPGDLIGGQIIFSARPVYPMTLTASQPTRLLAISRTELLTLLHSHQSFLLAFLRQISDNASRLSGKIRQTFRKPIRACVLSFLEDEIRRQGTNTIRLPWTKKHFAEKIGVQRTSLSRELQKMKMEGLIDYTAGTLTLLDPGRRALSQVRDWRF